MKKFLFLLLSIYSINCYGQGQDSSNRKWEYGIDVRFVSGIVKPISADTFTNKPGFGAGLFLERSFNSWALRFSPEFTQIRYGNDFENRNFITNSLDASLLISQALDSGRQAFIEYGPVFGYALQHFERNLDGSDVKSGFQNQLIRDEPFEIGLRLGIGMNLNPGVRLTTSYTDFFNGKQRPGSITGRIDYLQVGVQIRMRELLNSERLNEKIEAQLNLIETAHNAVKSLEKGSDGVLVFVLNTDRDPLISKSKIKDSIDQVLFKKNQEALIQAIERRYNFGPYVITYDSVIEHRSSNSAGFHTVTSEGSSVFDPDEKTLFYARIDELFIEENGNLKWGIFVFDEFMELLPEPFPYFTPYQNLDQDFSSTESMISSFNVSLKQLMSTAE